jgi:hypothetical protein
VLLLAGCGSSKEASTTTSSHAGTSTSVLAIAPAERPACALAFANLQRVTVAIRASSELIAHSSNKKELTRRIAIEEVQLRRSARLVASGPAPAALVPAVRELASALRAFSDDFARAGVHAARGDFRAASAAMTDAAVVKRIIRASKAIEDACR